MPEDAISHQSAPPPTLTAAIDQVARRLDEASLTFGHGTDNAADEAAWLVLAALGLPLDGGDVPADAPVTDDQWRAVEQLLNRRVRSREPLAYLLGEAWFCGLPFFVDRRVLVPRSPIAEMIGEQFEPWLQTDRVHHILDLCTGSGCIAVACAAAFPAARVDAADLSLQALAVAERNVGRHGMEQRVQVLQSDLFDGLTGRRYDLIVTNPPYVPSASMQNLAPEFQAEPALGLVAGDEGLDLILPILAQAPEHLTSSGVLVAEVGEAAPALMDCLAGLPMIWPHFESGGEGVFVVQQRDLLHHHQFIAQRAAECSPQREFHHVE